jgi:hypothetical protein
LLTFLIRKSESLLAEIFRGVAETIEALGFGRGGRRTSSRAQFE